MKIQKTIIQVASIITLIFIWQLSFYFFSINEVLFPSPVNVMLAFFESDKLIIDVAVSLLRLVSGALIGIFAGIIFGLLTARIEYVNNAFGHISNFCRFIPPLALVPLFLVWFGIGEFSKISLISWAVFFPLWISSFNGIKNIEKKYFLAAKSLNVSKNFFLSEVLVKGSMDYILNGVKIGVGFGFSVLIAAEMLGAFIGVGYRISFLQAVYRVDRMLGYIIVLGLVGLVIDKILSIISKKLTPWKNEA